MKELKQQNNMLDTGHWGHCEDSFDPQAGTWVSPQISYLSFKSLIQLRRSMNTGQWRRPKKKKKDLISVFCCMYISPQCSSMNPLTQGVMIFDCEEKTLADIAEKIVSEMVNKKEIRPENREDMVKVLLQNHRFAPRY